MTSRTTRAWRSPLRTCSSNWTNMTALTNLTRRRSILTSHCKITGSGSSKSANKRNWLTIRLLCRSYWSRCRQKMKRKNKLWRYLSRSSRNSRTMITLRMSLSNLRTARRSCLMTSRMKKWSNNWWKNRKLLHPIPALIRVRSHSRIYFWR